MKTTLLIIALLLLTIPASAEYKKDPNCVWDACHPKEIERMVEEYGTLPPSYFERHTEEWWHSTCTYSPQLCYN